MLYGGITGGTKGSNYKIKNCINNGKIIGTWHIGGIVGRNLVNDNSLLNNVIVDNCTNNAEVVASSNIVGGIAGISDSNINGCKNTGTVTSQANPDDLTTQGTGGIVGISSGIVSKCTNTGDISSSGFYSGGIIGHANVGTVVSKSYNCNANIQAKRNSAGGIIGRGAGVTIENCYNYLSSNNYYIKAQGDNAGGIIGAVAIDTNNTITNCYSIGNNIISTSDVENTPNYYVGAIAGVIWGTANITNVYYENTNPLQATSTESTGINGTIIQKTTEDFKKSKTDTNSVTYIFNGNTGEQIWGQDDNINGGYPYLIENKP